MTKSGRELGKRAVDSLKNLIETRDKLGLFLPCHRSGSALHLSEICRAIGVTRTTVNTNPAFRKVLQDYAAKHNLQYSLKGSVAQEEEQENSEDPLKMVPIAQLRSAHRKIANYERRLSELRAENAHLRSKIYQEHEVRNLIALGGRYLPAIDGEGEDL